MESFHPELLTPPAAPPGLSGWRDNNKGYRAVKHNMSLLHLLKHRQVNTSKCIPGSEQSPFLVLYD